MLEDEEAKAAQEVAKLASKGLDLVSEAGKSINRIFGGAIEHLAVGMSDKAALWRYKNMIKIADEIDAIHTARRISNKTIPLRPEFAIPIFEAASLEVDEEVQML